MLLEEIAQHPVAAAVTQAAAALARPLGRARIVVLASPHGKTTGVYAQTSGDLDAFGPRGLDASAATDTAFSQALAGRWGRPLLEVPADHGVVVPLRLLGPLAAPVVAVSFDEGLDAGAALAEGRALAEALGATGDEMAFVASANLSAGLGERAPLPSLAGAAAADEAVLEALRRDPADLARHLADLAAAGSCASGPLAAFGAVCAGRPCDVLAYEHPVGVGYAVARTPPSA